MQKSNQKKSRLNSNPTILLPFPAVRNQTRPSCVGTQTWLLSTASNGAKSGFELGRKKPRLNISKKKRAIPNFSEN
jgi:hypothetical protein